MPAFTIHVTGRVQGVFFRATIQEKAKSLGLTGWVRNTKQDSVEIFVEGEITSVQALEEWCHHGPPSAKVESVITKKVDEQHLPDFSIIL